MPEMLMAAACMSVCMRGEAGAGGGGARQRGEQAECRRDNLPCANARFFEQSRPKRNRALVLVRILVHHCNQLIFVNLHIFHLMVASMSWGHFSNERMGVGSRGFNINRVNRIGGTTSRRDYVEGRKLIGVKLDFILTPEVFADLSALARSLLDVLGQPRIGHAMPARPHFASGEAALD